MVPEEMVPFRVVDAIGNPRHLTLRLSTEGLDEPNSNIVLVWKDPKTDDETILAHWRGRDWRVINYNQSCLDFMNPDHEEIMMCIIPVRGRYDPAPLPPG